MEGKVKFFNPTKGFGFIVGDDEQDYFVHRSAVPEGVYLRDNDTVSFDPVDTDRGKQAQNVALVKKASESESETSEESQEATEEESEEEKKE